jgi:hypothetical protein
MDITVWNNALYFKRRPLRNLPVCGNKVIGIVVTGHLWGECLVTLLSCDRFLR